MTLPDAAAIERVARRVLTAPDAVIEGHTVSPLDYDAYRPGRTLTRIKGRATVGGHEVMWSVIRKWTDALAATPAAPLEGARREALAYRSGVAHASDGVRTPNAFAIDIHDGGPVEIWIEDVGVDEGSWTLETYAAAARGLGRFNGTWLLRGVPDHDWLMTAWAERQSEPVDMPAAQAEIAALATTEAVRDALGAGNR